MRQITVNTESQREVQRVSAFHTRRKALQTLPDPPVLTVRSPPSTAEISVPTLVHKFDKTRLESRDIPKGCVKDFRWSPVDDEIYVLLSREGQLFSGHVGETPLRVVNNNVVGVSWSPDGKHVAHVTNEGVVCVSSSKFEAQYNFKLPAEIGNFTDNLEVESLHWVRPDAMLVAYTQINEDEEDEECPLIFVTSRGGDLQRKAAQSAQFISTAHFLLLILGLSRQAMGLICLPSIYNLGTG